MSADKGIVPGCMAMVVRLSSCGHGAKLGLTGKVTEMRPRTPWTTRCIVCHAEGHDHLPIAKVGGHWFYVYRLLRIDPDAAPETIAHDVVLTAGR